MVPLCSSRHLAFVNSPPDLYDLQKASLSNLADELPVIEILHHRGPWRLDQVLSGQILDGRGQLDIGVRHVLYSGRRITDPERTQGVEPVEPVIQHQAFADPVHVDRLDPVPHEQNHRMNGLATRTKTLHGVGSIRPFVDAQKSKLSVATADGDEVGGSPADTQRRGILLGIQTPPEKV